jgi:tetratricopeptide (TPR) repeat protein
MLLKSQTDLIYFFLEQNNYTQAEALIDQNLKNFPTNHELFFLKAVLCALKNKHEEAVRIFKKIFHLYKNEVNYLVNYAASLNSIGDNESALKIINKALAISPNNYQTFFNKGNILFDTNKFSLALKEYGKAIFINPNLYQGFNNVGKSYHALKQFDKALIAYDKSIQINPEYAEAWSNKGVSLLAINQNETAISLFNEAIRLQPQFYQAYSNLGLAFHALKQFDKALIAYDKSIQINPEYTEAYLNKSFTQLLNCQFTDGWKNFEYRLKLDEFKNKYPRIPVLTSLKKFGESDRILVWYEQGMGDVIQFSRYVYLLVNMNVKVIFYIPKDLIGIFTPRNGLEITSSDAQINDVTYQVPLLSLPKIFQTSSSSTHHLPTQIQIDSEKTNLFKKIIGSSQPKVGLVCSGQINHRNDPNRTIPLRSFEPILLIKNFNYYLIQKDIRSEDAEYLRKSNILDMSSYIKNYTDTVAIIDNMDFLITVDTSVAHLAGSMGKRVYLLLPFCPDWRWQLNRTDSPWYESICIIRQDSYGNWNNVMNELKNLIQNTN